MPRPRRTPPGLGRAGGALGLAGAALAAYGGLVERNLFTLRRFAVPVLDPGTPALRVLHISDLHLTAAQRRKQAWVSDLARLAAGLRDQHRRHQL